MNRNVTSKRTEKKRHAAEAKEEVSMKENKKRCDKKHD